MDGNLADIESDDEEPPPLPGTIQISDEAKRFLRMRDALGPANTQSVFCVRLVVEKILQTVDAITGVVAIQSTTALRTIRVDENAKTANSLFVQMLARRRHRLRWCIRFMTSKTRRLSHFAASENGVNIVTSDNNECNYVVTQPDDNESHTTITPRKRL